MTWLAILALGLVLVAMVILAVVLQDNARDDEPLPPSADGWRR